MRVTRTDRQPGRETDIIGHSLALTKSDDSLLSSHMADIPITVVLTSGSVCSIVASLVVHFAVGGGRCSDVGVLGIPPP